MHSLPSAGWPWISRNRLHRQQLADCTLSRNPMPSQRRDIIKAWGAAALTGLAGRTSHVHAAGRSQPRIKIGQIGTGHPHATKLGVYRRSPDYELVGVVEADPALRQ